MQFLDLRELLQVAADQHQSLPKAEGLVEDVLTYILDRFRAWGQEEGISAEMYLAVRARPVTKPLDFARRLRAVKAFAQREEAAALAAANKRVSNILSKQAHDGSTQVDTTLLQESPEQTLAEAVIHCQQQVAPLFAAGEYQQALDTLATLREPVDTGLAKRLLLIAVDRRNKSLGQDHGILDQIGDIKNQPAAACLAM